MAQLWGGRFTKETDQLVYNFNASISFDKRFYEQDIRGSIAHVTMLAKQGILTEEEKKQIIDGLNGIREDVENGKLEITDKYEDIHSFVEANLIDRIGDAGKKLHTGRSRNDQVALDMRLYTRDEVLELDSLLKEILEVLLKLMKENVETYMPGFTHLQKAQPITLAHHMGAYFEMFRRDRLRMKDIYKRMNYCPLGAGALAGTTYPLDREYTAELLGFDGPTLNSMDSVSDRDYLIELLSAMSTIMMHLSRFSEEVIIWNSNEYQFVEIDDAYSTGSSIMPQKKNPDIAELVRGKTGRVYGALMSLLTTMKGIPLAYNKDMQEDKELVFDAIDTTKGCLALFTGMLRTMKFNDARMEESAKHGFTNATDAADYLVNHGMPFRDAHGIVGQLVLYGIEHKKALDDFTMEEFKAISPVFEEDIYDAISMKTCGATGMVGQRFISLLENHPWFEVVTVAASPRSAGKTYEEAVGDRWKMDTPMPEAVKKLVVLNVNDVEHVASTVDFVFSAVDMSKEEIKAIEEAYAKTETPVVSNNSAHRWTPDVPMVVPEINAEHFEVIKDQKKRLGTTRGFIAVKPNCSIQSYAPCLAAWKEFGPKELVVTTYQAISGAGKTFKDWPEMVGNIIPYIGGEEEKSEQEPLRVLGKVENGQIVKAELPKITCQCVRVPVLNGHTAAVFINFEKKPTKEQLIEKLVTFKGFPQEAELPSAPKQFIQYLEEDNRPQVAEDVNYENGMGVSIGRLREDSMFDYKFIGLSHNTVRGAAGGAVLCAEALTAKGYIEKK